MHRMNSLDDGRLIKREKKDAIKKQKQMKVRIRVQLTVIYLVITIIN